MSIRLLRTLTLAIALPLSLLCQNTSNPVVRFKTNLGDIDVTLLRDTAPKTVDNFLNYMNRGAYNGSFIHRSVRNFIVQGGGFKFQNQRAVDIPSDPPVQNEYRIPNTRGTLAMAKLGTNPNSATNQWFFNLGDNSGNLNNQNGGFTVFGRVANAAGLAVMDKIAAVPVPSGVAAAPFDSLPLMNYRGGPVQEQHLIVVTSIAVVETLPSISESGIVSASSFGGLPFATVGSFIEIYGANLAGSTRAWAAGDFTEGNAPTSLDEVTVTIDGKPAFVNFISPAQVNVQVPADVPSGGSVPVVVSYKGQSSAPVMFAIKPLAAGVLAPPAFKVRDKQYVAAIHANGGSFVTNGEVPGFTGAAATPGETLTIYGVGFGPLASGSAVAGKVATGQATVAAPVEVYFGDLQAQVLYAGVVPDLVGLYQLNVVVPRELAAGDVPVRVVAGGENISQALFIPVRAAP